MGKRGVDRRWVLSSGAALAAAAGSASAAPVGLQDAAREAWLYCLPLIEMATMRERAIGANARVVNSFVHARNLAGPQNRGVTTPNNDTLYSSAWIDLSGEPVTLTLPQSGARYFSLALMDMFTNNFAVLGTRTTGDEGGPFILAGPRGPAPAGAIRSPTPWVWALGRTLVDGAEDIDGAHTVQDSLTIRARPGRIPGPGPGRDAPWNEYFARAQELLKENPPPATDFAFFRRVAGLQLGPYGGFETARFADSEVELIAAGVEQARSLVQAHVGEGPVQNGWIYPKANLGDYGQDYGYRATMALTGLGALPPSEAMYMRPISPEGLPTFDAAKRWRLHLPSALPVDAFWSLSMYEATPDGQLFFSENPLGRYAIGYRTQGLSFNADGSLDIWISRVDPGGTRSANWLPAPSAGRFMLTMRAYLPKPEFVDGHFHLPPVELVGAAPPAPATTPPPYGPNGPYAGPPPPPRPTPTPRRRRRR